MFTVDEKTYLMDLIKRELAKFKKEGKIASAEAAPKFLKAEHEYGHFLERLIEKLE